MPHLLHCSNFAHNCNKHLKNSSTPYDHLLSNEQPILLMRVLFIAKCNNDVQQNTSGRPGCLVFCKKPQEARAMKHTLVIRTPMMICLSEETTMTSEAPFFLWLHAFFTMYVSASLRVTNTATTCGLTCVNVPCASTNTPHMLNGGLLRSRAVALLTDGFISVTSVTIVNVPSACRKWVKGWLSYVHHVSASWEYTQHNLHTGARLRRCALPRLLCELMTLQRYSCDVIAESWRQCRDILVTSLQRYSVTS